MPTLSRRSMLAASITTAIAAPHLLACQPDAPAATPADTLMTTHLGSLPIVLSAPHGGVVRVPGSRDRTRGTLVRDMRTAEVTLLLAQRLADLLGALPSMVVAQFSRRDLDPNREPSGAYENEPAARQYDAYHAALRRAVDQARIANPAALLLDIHGQSRRADAVYRGTRTGRTVARLLDAHGPDALEGPDSLFGRLSAAGWPTLPETTQDDDIETETDFNGGHIVAHYGSHNDEGIDAIQIELGSDFRHPDRLVRTAHTLADAVAHAARRYIIP